MCAFAFQHFSSCIRQHVSFSLRRGTVNCPSPAVFPSLCHLGPVQPACVSLPHSAQAAGPLSRGPPATGLWVFSACVSLPHCAQATGPLSRGPPATGLWVFSACASLPHSVQAEGPLSRGPPATGLWVFPAFCSLCVLLL